MAAQQIGLVGLAVMGENLALNIESKGFSVAVYNRTAGPDPGLPRRPGARARASPARTRSRTSSPPWNARGGSC